MPHVSRLQTKAIDPGKRMPLLDQWDLGEWAECADEAQPGAIEEQPHELGGGEKGVGLHVAGHPCSVQLRAHIDEQSKNAAFNQVNGSFTERTLARSIDA